MNRTLIVFADPKNILIRLGDDGVVETPDELAKAIDWYETNRVSQEPDLIQRLLYLMRRDYERKSSIGISSETIKELVYVSPDAKLTVTRSDQEHAAKYDLVQGIRCEGGNIHEVRYTLKKKDPYANKL